ncbi:Arrestin_C domain-containing protein [Mucor velutinosus]|uniref:Arrestin_C domain-containing protein n=1 Tax=Mucor velutinosus TaxID=708070 RepID=A0AAN7I3W3_9FUNG|nr:Arrestin_C domain-containing protein [Mucor velutinosus]
MDQLEHDDIIKKKYLARGSGDAATKAYIASKYLSGPSDEKKKKKRKKTHTINNIGIIDEEDMSWETAADTQIEELNRKQEQEKLEREAIQNAGGVFRGTTANWETIQGGKEEEQDEEKEDEQPQVVQQQQDNDQAPRMSNGQRAGVLTKAQIKAEAERAKHLEREAMERLSKQEAHDADTVYRDATGKKVDPKMKRAEEARRRKEQIEKEARKMEWGKGLVQRREAEDERRRLEEEKHKPMARYADDEDLNEELKEKERWNDPAAGFLTKKTTTSKGKRLVKPTYKGAWKPNRFMIPPGYRWDGVDRSTGFEDTFLLQQNQAKSFAAQAHAWSTEDM